MEKVFDSRGADSVVSFFIDNDFVDNFKQSIQDSKLDDLSNNFQESWDIGGCCE